MTVVSAGMLATCLELCHCIAKLCIYKEKLMHHAKIFKPTITLVVYTSVALLDCWIVALLDCWIAVQIGSGFLCKYLKEQLSRFPSLMRQMFHATETLSRNDGWDDLPFKKGWTG